MSSHYEMVFSLFLRDDTPGDVLDELRWHLGLSEQRPTISALHTDYPLMRPGDSYLPGGDVTVLQRQYRYDEMPGVKHYAWGLYARLFWLDDHWAQASWQIANWLAPYVEEDGYAGFFREETDERPTLLVIHGGEAHLRNFAGHPEPLSS
jgi:hypothetical protein